ncbi:hypothetical protein MRX96_049113 [Rhipicephalus microplus]
MVMTRKQATAETAKDWLRKPFYTFTPLYLPQKVNSMDPGTSVVLLSGFLGPYLATGTAMSASSGLTWQPGRRCRLDTKVRLPGGPAAPR